MENKKTVYWLTAANMIPLFGLLLMGWNIFSIMLAYWAENVVIGIYNIGKIYKAERLIRADEGVTLNDRPVTGDPGLFVIFFFIIHYGIFTIVHGAFVIFLFGQGESLDLFATFLIVSSFLISHGISYIKNFIGKEEYKSLSRVDAMMLPYKRVVILHITIMAGAFFIQLFGLKFFAVAVLIAAKTMVDIYSHKREHERFLKTP